MNSRLNMIKSLFTNKKCTRNDFMDETNAKALTIQKRLEEINCLYTHPSLALEERDISMCKEIMPTHIIYERDQLLRKLNDQHRIMEREYDRSYIEWRIFWAWLLRR